MTNLNINTANAVSLNTQSLVQTMSSREIAELTGKRHPDIKRDIEVMFEQLNLDVSNFAHNYFDSLNRQQTEYALDKELSTCLVSGYNVQLRMAIIRRWTELEVQVQQFQLPTTFSEALMLAAKLEEERLQLALEVKQQQLVIEQQQPTMDAYELIAGRKGVMKFQDAYKLFGGMKLKEVKQWMHEKKWLYYDRHNNEAVSQTYIVKGYLVLKASDKYKPQIKVTYKGIAAMARQLKIKLNTEDFE